MKSLRRGSSCSLIKFFPVTFYFIMMTLPGAAQLTVVQGGDMALTPEQLIRDHLIGNGLGIYNVTLNGSDSLIHTSSAGYFHAAGGAFNQLKMKDGIIITSGRADYAIGPNNKPDKGIRTDTGGDPDLDVVSGTTTFDACIIEFDFIPQCDTLKFRYAFGSEEFFEFCGHTMNDAFGFFLSGPGINGGFSNNSMNIAKMPGSSEFVTINNICSDSSSVWNNQSGQYFQYDGITHVFTAWYIVIPYQAYHLKMAIADAVDALFDSGVFLEKGSFSAGFEFNVENVPSAAEKGQNAIEACNDITVSFTLPEPAKSQLLVSYTIEGTAIYGVDYDSIPLSVIFQTGQDSAAVTIHPLADGIPEGTETVILKIMKRTCYDTITIYDTIFILDNSQMEVFAGCNTKLCPGDTLKLVAQVIGGVGPFAYYWEDPPSQDSIILIYPPLESHTYILHVTDQCNDTASNSMTVIVDTIALLTDYPLEKTICSGERTEIILNANITSASFSWEPVLNSGDASGYYGGTGDLIDQVLIVSNQVPAIVNYQVQVTGNGCDTTLSDFLVTVNPVPTIDLGDPVFMEPGSQIRLHAGSGYADYLWSTGSSDSVITVSQGGIYSVTVKNDFGCGNSDSIMVNELGLYVPNAFSPNGDGLNDRFRIMGFGQDADVMLRIFNRWGDMVFETKDPEEGWDGTFNGQSCPQGMYVWIIHHGSGLTSVYKGTVTLVR